MGGVGLFTGAGRCTKPGYIPGAHRGGFGIRVEVVMGFYPRPPLEGAINWGH